MNNKNNRNIRKNNEMKYTDVTVMVNVVIASGK